ncbi:type 1 glutamine amidotransferase [Streptomyces chartreusis]|uniref:type 1 glutamine amidotransferase n=1 Tax=Streptomyces chartreusis TaxID=1969 RepID=UPI00382BD0B7
MVTRALVLVHDPAHGRRNRILGALMPSFTKHDIDHDVVSFVNDSEIAPELGAYDLLVVLGSHESVYDPDVPWLADELVFVTEAIKQGMPSIGICFGGQLFAQALHGTIMRSSKPEVGFTEVESHDPELIPNGPWMQMHADSFIVPPKATELARNASGSQAFIIDNTLALQFHPEITADSFESWVERWASDGEPTVFGGGRLDIDALRRDIASHEESSVKSCGQLIETFCARYLK